MNVFHAETVRDEGYSELVCLLRHGGIVVFPTDTAYALGGDPFNEAAVERIFAIKGRPKSKPLLLLVSSISMAETATEPVEVFHRVAQAYWPGPLTLITSAARSLPASVTAGTGTIGVRWPLAPFATDLIGRFGAPIIGTSANRSGMPAAITADEAHAQLDEAVDALVDGGSLPARGGSTMLDLTLEPPVVLREGPVSFESLERFFEGKIRRHAA